MSDVIRRWSSERSNFKDKPDLPQTAPFVGDKDSVGFALAAAIGKLNSDDPRLDAEALLAHAMGVPRSWRVAHPETEVTPKEHERFDNAVQAVVAGRPLPYVIGQWEFYKLNFKIDPRVLIPRPETELLVDTALAWGRRRNRASIADIGTGAGNIAIALAVNIPTAEITATDVSQDALAVARDNAIEHTVSSRIQFVDANLLQGLGRFDLIACNPPYVATDVLAALPSALHEPRVALDGGADGLEVMRALLAAAPSHLNPQGVLLMEIGHDQRAAVLELAQAAFPDAAACRVLPDLAHNDRLLVVQS